MDDLVRALIELRSWAGDPSYASIADAVGRLRAQQHRSGGRPGKVTVYDCFRLGRRRLNQTLFLDLIAVLGVPLRSQEQWWQAYRAASAGAHDQFPVTYSGDDLALWPPQARLVGRDAELARLAVMAPGSVAVVVGPAGSGKTELALHLAHRWQRGLGPQAVALAVNLRGYERDLAPLTSMAVLARLLSGLGARPEAIDRLAEADRVALLRRVLADRTAVFLLDNARSEEQILPLLPVSARSRVVVTSRSPVLGAQPWVGESVVLNELSPAASRELIANRIGWQRLTAEPQAADRIVSRCGHLPLDLSVVAAAIAAESEEWSLADHAARLEALPPDEFLRPALQLSYAALPEPVRRSFRTAGLHPGPWFDAAQLAALVDLAVPVVAGHLDQLANERLVIPVASGYAFHDVVRGFALRQSVRADPRSQQVAAFQRLIRYLAAEIEAHAAPGRPDNPWLSEHVPLIVGLVDSDYCDDLIAELVELVIPVIEYLDVSGQLTQAESLLRAVLSHQDAPQRTTLRRKLGRILELRGHLTAAWEELTEALDPTDVDYGRALNGVGNVLKRMGRAAESVHYYRLAVLEAVSNRDCFAQGRAYGNLADALRELGHLLWADHYFAVARQCSLQAQDRVNLAIVLSNRCELVAERGDYAEAVELVAEALPVFDELGFMALRVNAEAVQARCLLAAGDLAGCDAALGRAEAQVELSGMPEQRCHLQVVRGRLWLARGDSARAAKDLRVVLRDAERLGLTGIVTQVQALLAEAGR